MRKNKLPNRLVYPLVILFVCSSIAFGQSTSEKLTEQRATAALQHSFEVGAKEPLTKALERLEKKFNVAFMYKSEWLEKKFVVRNARLSDNFGEELNRLLVPFGLSWYRLNDRSLAIVENEEVTEEEIPFQHTVRGRVFDEATGEALPGVNLIVKGTTLGTSTDIDGRYQLSLPSETDTLTISFIGYKTREIPIEGRAEIDISMQMQAISGDELVVVGYGTVRRGEVTGSVSTVGVNDFNQGSITNPLEMLQGKVAGLSVTRTNGGDPTQGFEVRLRGSSSLSASEEPLIVIDGIPGGDLNAINPDEIESVNILKDGSAAAIYGTRGTNGVILITTKKGRPGTFQIEYSAKVTTQRTLENIDVLSASEYREMKNRLSQTHPDVANSMTDYGTSTDWYDALTRSPFSHNHSLALSGGTEATTYRASLFFTDEEGLLLNSAASEYRASFNLQQSALNDRLQIDMRLGVSEREQNPVDYNALRQAIKRNPTEPVYNEDGSLFELVGAWEYENPVGILVQRTNDQTNNRYYGNLGATLQLGGNVEVSALAGIQNNRWLNGSYTPSYAYPQLVEGRNGTARREAGLNRTNTFESTIEWREDIANHTLAMIGGYSYQDFTTEEFWAENTDFITDGFGYNNLGSGQYLTNGQAGMSSEKEESRLVGYFARANYNYRQTYFLSTSVRYEGSSKFGDANKWGLFPAVSAAWELTNESFITFLNPFELFKLRAGYGVTGNEGIGPYIPLQRLGSAGYFFYEGEFIPGYQPVSNPNPNLKWETKHELNIGLDWALTNGRIGGALEYYRRDTRDLLHEYDVPVPPNLYGSTWANVGSMRNTGLEVTFNTIPLQSSNVTWNLDFNIDFRKNELLSLSSDEYQLEYRNVGDIGPPGISAWTHRYEPGRSIGSIHAYKFEGLTDEGGWIFQDVNDDGEITTDDRTYVGNGIPDLYTGLTSRLQYKNWDFIMMMRGAFGHQIINHARIWSGNPKFLPNNIMRSAFNTDLWDDPAFSSYYVEDGDFLKIDNVTLGYSLPVQDMGLGINRARFFATTTNLLVITGYSGLDPESAIGGLQPGFDNRFGYPSTRTFTLGVNLSF